MVVCDLGWVRLSPTVRHCGCICCLTFPEVVLQQSFLRCGWHIAGCLGEDVHCPREVDLCSGWFPRPCGDELFDKGCFSGWQLVTSITG